MSYIFHKVLLWHLILCSSLEAKKRVFRSQIKETSKAIKTPRSETEKLLSDDDLLTFDKNTPLINDTKLKYYEPDLLWPDEDDVPGYFWHRHKDDRDSNLQDEAKIALDMDDRFGDKLMRDLRTRRSATTPPDPPSKPKRPPPWEAESSDDEKLPSRRLIGVRIGLSALGLTHTTPYTRQMRYYVLRLIQEAVYQAQESIEGLDKTLNDFGWNLKFKISYALRLVETLLKDMRIIQTRLRRDEMISIGGLGFGIFKFIRTSNTNMHLIYYEYVFSKYIDITYIVEQICHKYDIYQNSKEKELKIVFKMKNKGRG